MFKMQDINWEQLLTNAGVIVLKLIAITIVFLLVRAIGKKLLNVLLKNE